MKNHIIHIFDLMKAHKVVGIIIFSLITVLLTVFMTRQTYKEDISDFLPVEGDYQLAMDTYQKIAGADRIFVTVELADTTKSDPDLMLEAINCFEQLLQENDKDRLASDITAAVDMERLTEVAESVYTYIPLFLTDADIDSIQTKIADPQYVYSSIARAKQQLLLPLSGLTEMNIRKDPAGLFEPIISRLQNRSQHINYELYGGGVFTPDMKRAVVTIRSPFGSSETDQNGRLIDLLTRTARQTETAVEGVELHITGGPAIAVGNASQIKTDSLIAVFLAVLLILILLVRTIRSKRNILLIAISVAWGWLFAVGGLSMIHADVSIIVIGISSLIIGIAVNYPLHYVAHLRHQPDRKEALREIVTPLLVGNITTVGAFLALVPLKSLALRDLGLFAALLLTGTILFVLFLLPHIVKVRQSKAEGAWLRKIGSFSPERSRWIAVVVAVLTIVMLFFCFDNRFDTNLSHINYMTDEQRDEMKALSQLVAQSDSLTTVYVVSYDVDEDKAMQRSEQLNQWLDAHDMVKERNSCYEFLCAEKERKHRLDRWRQFVDAHGGQLKKQVEKAAQQEGFTEGVFDDFYALLESGQNDLNPMCLGFLQRTLFDNNVLIDSMRPICRIVDELKVDPEDVQHLERQIREQMGEGVIAFDVEGLNSTIANNLSVNFNYIGWACGLIVFLFLWYSMGSIELALLSFLPMAVSWIWILGLMSLLGIQFNVVNVILATFIFGQGDDYTIFITEGCQYEYAYRRKMLAAYKSSIIISALIMFIGIGTLIIAKHPALRSLAQLTILGMFTVVLMAYLIPPLIFRWLTRKNGKFRLRPLSVRMLWDKMRGAPQLVLPKPESLKPSEADSLKSSEHKCLISSKAVRNLVIDRYRYKGRDIMTTVCADLRRLETHPRWSDEYNGCEKMVILNSGYGHLPLAFALAHPDIQVLAFDDNSDNIALATYSAESVASNLVFSQTDEQQIKEYHDTSGTELIIL